MANLLLHQGTQLVNREELWHVETPPATRSWQPISHGHLLHTVHQQLQQADYAVTSESHGLSHDTKRYFGLLEVRGRNPTRDFRTVVGIRNAHDKSFPAGLCLGTCVLVCDNLSFSGELRMAIRAHITFSQKLGQPDYGSVGADHALHPHWTAGSGQSD